MIGTAPPAQLCPQNPWKSIPTFLFSLILCSFDFGGALNQPLLIHLQGEPQCCMVPYNYMVS